MMKITRSKLILVLLPAIVILVCGVLLVHAYTSKPTSSNPKDQSERVIAEVSRIYLVPTNETPTVARLQDKSKIDSNKAFYKNAQDGDYLVLYSQNGLALLYREQVNKLVNVAPITDSGVTPTQPSPQ